MKKYKNKLAMLTLMLSCIFMLSAPLSADIGSGEGGGNTTNPGANPVWRVIKGTPGTSQAWNQFMNNRGVWTGLSNDSFERNHIDPIGTTTSGDRLSNACRVSGEIWYVSQGSNTLSWAQHVAGTNRSSWLGGHPEDRGGESRQMWTVFKTSPAYKNSWSNGRINLVCSTGIGFEADKPGPPKWVPTDSKGVSFEGSKKYVIQKGTVVKLNASRPDWKGQAQPANNKMTPAGSHLNTAASMAEYNKITTPDQWNAWTAKADKLSQDVSPEVTLNDYNQAKMLEGGVMDVTESTQTVTYTIKLSGKQAMEKECIPWYNYKGQQTSCKDTGKTRPKGNAQFTGKPSSVMTGLVPTTQWQVLTVRCNADEFSSIMSKVGGTVYSTNGAQGFNVGYTSPKPVGTVMPLGNRNHADALVRTTATNVFFTKTASCERSFVCTPNKTGPVVDASSNIFEGIGAQPIDNGAVSVQITDIKTFEFFRDNDKNGIRANISYPKATATTGEFTLATNKASKTLIARDPNGTPTDDLFTMGLGENTVKFTDNKLAVNAHYNKFNVQGSWASDEGKPQRLNITWVYDVNVKSKLPITVNGKKIIKDKDTSAKIDVFCDFNGANSNDVPNPKISTSGGDYKPDNFNENKSHIDILFNRAVAQ